MSTSPGGARDGSTNEGSSNGNLEEKPRLSEQEKKANHIASEQKRRQAIREGFDRLTELVPGLEGQGRSESVVLKKTVDFMRAQVEERRRLVERIDELGGQVAPELRRDTKLVGNPIDGTQPGPPGKLPRWEHTSKYEQGFMQDGFHKDHKDGSNIQ